MENNKLTLLEKKLLEESDKKLRGIIEKRFPYATNSTYKLESPAFHFDTLPKSCDIGTLMSHIRNEYFKANRMRYLGYEIDALIKKE